MVETNSTDGATFCLPKNLSNEDYHDFTGTASQIHKALKLCECKGDRAKCVALHEKKIPAVNTTNHFSSQRRTTQKENIRAKNFVGSPCCSRFSAKTNQSLVASDLSRRASHKIKSNSSIMNGSSNLPETGDGLGNEKVDEWFLPSQSPVSSEPDTIFSEDYIAMTDGESSQETNSAAMSQSSLLSNCSSLDTIDTELEKLGLKCNEENTYCSGDSDGSHGSHFCREKEVPNLKLLLGRSPEELSIYEEEQESPPASPEEGQPKKNSTPFFEQDEFEYLKTERVRRSSSLKTYKTPPGTPSRKKAVRFADVLGLDLEDVRHFLKSEEPPVVPPSAMKDLQLGLEEEHKEEGTRYLRACFSQPGANLDFVTRVLNSKVALENCLVNDSDLTLTGVVRVANLSFDKRVVVRFSTNRWITFTDINANYVLNSNDGPTDRFAFTISVPSYFQEGSKLEFAVMYSANGQEFWDSNYGSNYVVECYAKSVPTGSDDKTWMHFL